jgi:DNA replication licensing factor MCM5
LQHEVLPIEQLKRFIAYARASCHPTLEQEAAEELQNQFCFVFVCCFFFCFNVLLRYVLIRDAVRQRSVVGAAAPIPITVRQLEAIVRISEALAKQELSPNATRTHVQVETS